MVRVSFKVTCNGNGDGYIIIWNVLANWGKSVVR
jgi:hypothetical protein